MAVKWVYLRWGWVCFLFLSAGATGDRDSDDGRPLSLVNRRPSISAPISSRKPSGSRIHTPPPASPAELLIGDGASSTPKRLTDGKFFFYDRIIWEFVAKVKEVGLKFIMF